MLITQIADETRAIPKPARVSQLTDVQLSHLRGKTGNSAAAACHAVRYRLGAPVDLITLRERFEQAIQSWQVQQGDEDNSARMPRLWMESVPGGPDSQIAERQRNSELMRPVELLDGPPCRAVLLQYQDRTADFIVVAHRAVLDRKTLLWIAGAPFRSDSDSLPSCSPSLALEKSDALTREQYLDELRNGSYSSRADWGMGNERDAGSKLLKQWADFKEGIDAASLLSAVTVVLARYSGQTAPVIATLATDPEEREAIGANEGMALVPLSHDASLSGKDLLARTAQRLSNPAWYTASLAGTLASNCENRGEVLAGVLFAGDHPEVSGNAVAAEYVPCLAAPFPLTITCSREKNGDYRLTGLFRLKDFASSVVAQFMNAIVRVHGALCRYPDATLGCIDMLSAVERDQLAELARPGHKLEIPDERIESVFSKRALEHPQALALSYGEDNLTYRELEEHSNRMAQALRDCGVRNGDRVGVCMERSLELVEVLLAILKAGAAYVPMDPAYPADRIAYTIQDAQIKIVVASVKGFQASQDVRMLEAQELLKMVPRCHEAPPSNASASDTAYVIYTSGSTGRPKGVVIPHRNVVALLAATTEDFGLSSRDTWTLFHSSAFDFSVWEIWGCLLTGGHLVVAPYWIVRNPEEFAELLAKENVTVLNQTPSAFAQLLDVDRNHPLPSSLRLVIFGGEPLDARMLLPWFDQHPEFECRMVNMFGITETTVHVTLETITREHALAGSKSVGHAMPGWYYYVMDTAGRPLPPGIAGEIYVGGAGVAQYYLNRAELTAQRFVPDPYTGERIYRSGDKGRLRPDGKLEHLGRLDTQVKIRGFRIELDEVRSMILEAPGVHTAAVVLHQDDPKDPATAKLCGYVVLNGGNISEVRSHIARMLPEYMVPSVLIEMPALPLTQNGKLDTKKLPAPSRNGHRPHNLQPAHNNEEDDADGLTSSMLQIWETVLGVPVGLDDNFFDLGGNSLYAMRIATAMRNQGLPSLPVRELYVQQTIRRLGASLKR